MRTQEYIRGWNDALNLAHEQIQEFALSCGLDTESSAYRCDQIVESLAIIPVENEKTVTQYGGTWVCPKCMRIHKPEKGCGIRPDACVRLPINASMKIKTAGDTLDSITEESDPNEGRADDYPLEVFNPNN